MGNVDLADQLRNHYRYDSTWHRNRKWWWSIWWWGFQLLLTNSFILYKKFHFLHDSTDAVTHYQFIKQICLAWIDRERHWPKHPEKISQKRKSPEDDKVITRGARKKIELDLASSSSVCTIVTDKTLHPLNGHLRIRLDYSQQHFPEQPTATKPRCSLHRWARGRHGKAVTSSIVKCSICKVHLCIACFNIFHKESNVLSKKEEISAM